MWRSSSVPITQKDLLSSRSGGSSNERSHGSGGADVSPKIGRISIARRSHFCVSLQSGLCCENYAIPHDLSGQTLSKFARAAHEFAVYIASNADSLINYGERFRAGERISSSLAESTVNAVISKRFAKRQQMQWTKRGAHLLLQTRTRALDGTLRPLFEKWYPGLANDNLPKTAQAETA